MKISKLHIKNFRSIRNERISIDDLTMFVGPNGCGKSTFLKALNFFYEPKTKVSKEDFFNRNVDCPIEIEVTYIHLTKEEENHFEKYLTVARELIVTKKFITVDAAGSYYGKLKKCPELNKLERKPVETFKKQYNELRALPNFSDLGIAKNAQDIEEAILEWEKANPDKLEIIESQTQFFGFENSSAASLERFTKFVYIPAVMVESYLEDTKNGPISELTDILARHQLKEDAEIKALEAEIKQRFSDRLKPFNSGQMMDLSKGLTDAIQMYYRDVGIRISLDENVANVNLPTPKAIININESGYSNPLSSAGQGLQRAFILSLLQYFAESRSGVGKGENNLNLILGIDEPELYQHPSKQKLFYNILKSLTTKGSDLAANIQCCYTTHSPLMLDIEQFNNVIRVSKEPCGKNEPCETKVYKSSLSEIANQEALLPSKGQSFTELKTLSSLINTLDSRINEGFFSRTVVLVEGASDVVALRAAASNHPDGAINLERCDISIIECGGKNNLEKPKIVFQSLGINTYCIWDSDYKQHEEWLKACEEEEASTNENKANAAKKKSAKKEARAAEVRKNRDLLALHNESENDWPQHIGLNSAAHKDNLETTLCAELGEEYLKEIVERHNKAIQAKSPWKNPLVMKIALEEAFKEGKRSVTLDNIIRKIIALNHKSSIFVN